MATRSPDLREVLRKLRDGIARDLRVALPARVERYDPATQLADVQPLLADWFEAEDEVVEQLYLPVVCNVPVVFPGAGGFRLTFPVAVGETVLLVVADRSLDAWISEGGKSAPADLRRHNISDAVAIVGLHDSKHAWSGAATDALTIGKDGGPQVKFKATTIELGDASDAMALASKVTAQLTAFKNAVNSWVVVPGDGGAALKTELTALFATWPGSVASATVKAKD